MEGGKDQPSLPSGYKEVKSTTKKIKLSPSTYFWLKEDYPVNLSLVTLDDGKQFYLGSAVGASKTLVEAADNLVKVYRQDEANADFYRSVISLMSNGRISCLQNPNSSEVIYNTRSTGTNPPRVYFSRNTAIEGLPVFVKLAACCHNDEKKIYRLISKSIRVSGA